MSDLTKKGREFIEYICSNDNDILSGKNNKKFKYSDVDVVYTPEIYFNEVLVTTPKQYSDLLINSFNKYGREFNLDSNVLAAQAFQESRFKPWNYSEGNAMGVTQFLPTTMFNTLLKNTETKNNFTTEEKNILFDGLSSEYVLERFWYTSPNKTQRENDIAKNIVNKAFENLRNNPDLAIKMQASLMNYIASRNNNLISSTLMAYNRGSGLQSKTYGQLIQTILNRTGGAGSGHVESIDEGAKYVERIFKILGDPKTNGVGKSFGYDNKIDFTIVDTKYNNKSLFLG